MMEPIIPCELLPETQDRIHKYAEALKHSAHMIGAHGLSEDEFWRAGLFRSAVERLRGTQAASMSEKRNFVAHVLDYLKDLALVKDWRFSGTGERHDYEVVLPDERMTIIETKGCLDGNNTNIFERPPQADEFIIWSLCQNPGADPRKNAWSGLHTRLSAEIIHRNQRVDAVVIWDMVCGTIGRPCPKANRKRDIWTYLSEDTKTPPPCLYLLPRSVPDPRNNPKPRCWSLTDVGFARALSQAFKCDDADVIQVSIEARMEGAETQRRTCYTCEGREIVRSNWASINRARR